MSGQEDYPAESVFTLVEQEFTTDGIRSTVIVDGQVVEISPISRRALQEIFRLLQEAKQGEQDQ